MAASNVRTSLRLAARSRTQLGAVQDMANGFPSLQREAIKRASLAFKNDILPRELAGKNLALGRPLSGFAPRPVRLGAGFNEESDANTIGFLHRARPSGVWALVELGADPHAIAPRGIGTRQARAALRTGGLLRLTTKRAVSWGRHGQTFAAVRHPGTRPKLVWKGAVQRFQPIARQVIRQAQTEALARALRGGR